ncbi:NAD(P)H-dependent flavin oxidoreductase [Bacteroides propionicifaciens]|uniref:NAD(P)H-dependent flavin oxidoreductase n=1 Tax=Bacteroides propionicifaciens TaxID=392838 RepID=UPI0003764C8C|nr:nitronate monooxygenase [Bacteroides propionicifaciens]
MKHLNLKYPIIQGPIMGGITTPQLVSQVSNSGALGTYAGGYTKPVDFEEDIKEILALTDHPFNVNLFVPNHYSETPDAIQEAIRALTPVYNHFELTPRLPSGTPQRDERRFNQQVDIIIKYQLPICSFSFGIPNPTIIKKLKDAEVYLIGTATTMNEALAFQEAGVDAIILQGSESGGPLCSFNQPPVGTELKALLLQANQTLTIPIIASGGIMDKEQVNAALELGVVAVQMGTAFLLTDESGACDAHKDAITNQEKDNTTLTPIFTGRFIRVVRNKFIDFMESQPPRAVITYPLQDSLTKSIRKYANQLNEADYIALWCNTNGFKGKKQSVESLLKSLV